MKGNEVGPRANLEILLSSIILIIDLIISGNIFGSVAVLVQMRNRKANELQDQVDIAYTSMQNMKIPVNLQHKVKDFITHTQATWD